MENEHHSPRSGDSGKRATGAVEEGLEKAKAKASQTFEEAQRQGKSHLDAQKDKAVEQVEKLSDALGQASARLRDEGQPSLATYTDQVASSMTSLAEKFRERSVDDLIRETKNLARREPALFLAGSVALGFAISRFFKASSTDQESGQPITSNTTEVFPERAEPARPPAYEKLEGSPGAGALPQQDRPLSPENLAKKPSSANLEKKGV